jgi:thiol:disulfide interchange protein DsbA
MKLSIWNKAVKSALVLLVATGINAFGFSEGKDYVTLEKPIPNAEKTLIKVFSYDCPFCYKYDKSVTPNVVKKIKDAEYKVFHLHTKGKYGKQASTLFAALIIKDRDNGITDLFSDKAQFKKAKMAYYNAYHDKKERWDAGEDAFIETGLKASGLSKADFEAAKADPRVQELVSQWDASYDVAKIQGVPAFVVNGKYLILTKSIRSIDGMAELVNTLLAK